MPRGTSTTSLCATCLRVRVGRRRREQGVQGDEKVQRERRRGGHRERVGGNLDSTTWDKYDVFVRNLFEGKGGGGAGPAGRGEAEGMREEMEVH